MRLGSFQLSRPRTLRALGGFVVAFLMAGHVLAATGLCVVTVPDQPASIHAADVACDHAVDESRKGTGAKHHCPAEEPSPQARSLDLPSASAVAVVASTSFYLIEPVSMRAPLDSVHDRIPPPPLHAWPQRLRL